MENDRNPIIFIFSGQVNHWERICEDLYYNEPVYKEWIDKIDNIMLEYYRYSILNKVKAMTPEERYNSKDICIGLSFILMHQIALFELYKYYGIHPTIVLGHSIGEFPAAYAAGMIDLRTAIRLVYNRGCFMENIGETLLYLSMTIDNYNKMFSKEYPQFLISCINSKNSIVIAGKIEELEEFSKKIKKEHNIFSVLFGSPVPVHTKYMSRYSEAAKQYKIQSISKPKIPMVSCFSGEFFNESFLYDENYDEKSLITTVNFELAVNNVFKYIESNKLGSCPIIVEITCQVLMVNSLKEIVNDISPYFKKDIILKNIFTFTRLKHYKQFYSSIKNIYNLQYNIIDKSKNQIDLFIPKDNSPESLIKSNILNFISKNFEIDSNNLNNISLGELGADSLFLVGLRNFVSEKYVDNLFTVTQLREFKISEIINKILNEGDPSKKQSIKFDLNFWKNEIILNESIKPKTHYKINNTNLNGLLNIFLTGSTGYLGIFLLYDLLKSNRSKMIYCLIRNKKSINDAYNSIVENFKKQQLFNKLTKEELKRIQPVIGDMSKPNFNLPKEQYDFLSNEIDVIINSAANVDLATIYTENKEVNVNGTIEIIKFSFNINLKKLITFSTNAIYLNTEYPEEFNENKLIPLENMNNLSGYAQSKVVSEYLLFESSKRGLEVMNIRPPFIFADPETGSGNENDMLQLFLSCSYSLKCYPNLGENYKLYQVPVTWLSKNVINQFLFNKNLWNDINGNKFKSYNLLGDLESIETFFSYLDQRFPMKTLNYDDWVKLVLQSNEMCCIRLRTFHNLKLCKDIYISNSIKMSIETKSLLSKDWKITKETIYNFINFQFNLNNNNKTIILSKL